MADDDLMPLAEIGRRLGIPYSTLRLWQYRDRIKRYRIGDKLVFSLSEVQEFVSKARPEERKDSDA